MPTFIELVPCPTCDGSGDHPLNAMYQCGDCLGMGHVAVNAPARTYALPLAGGGFTGDAPIAQCAWNTIGNPTVPQSNFRWGRLLGGIISALKKFAGWWT